jgi:hypothetical protein
MINMMDGLSRQPTNVPDGEAMGVTLSGECVRLVLGSV